jgi:hypothetical protein
MTETVFLIAGAVAVAATLLRIALLNPSLRPWRSARWWARDALLVLAGAVVVAMADVLCKGPPPSAREALLMVGLALGASALALNTIVTKREEA